MGTGAGTDGHGRAALSQLPRRVSFARLAGTGAPAPWLRYVVAATGALGALVLTATMLRREGMAVVAVGSAAVFLIALWRISAVTLALIPAIVLSAEPIHNMLPATILVGVLAFAAVLRFCVGSLHVRPPHLCVAVLVVVVVLSYLFPAARLAPMGQMPQNLISVLAGLVVVTVTVAAPPTARALLRVILMTGTIVGAVASAQGDYVDGRLQGFGLNPNYLAVYLAAPIVISIGLALRHRNPLWLAPGAACVPALLASQSREGFLATVAGAAFVVIQGRPRVQKVLIILAAAVAVLAFPEHLNGIARLGAGSRSAVDLNADNAIRTHVALFAVHTALSHPLLGIGVGHFPTYAAFSSGLGIYITTTNEYLLLASETGLIALAAFLLLLWLAVRKPCHGDMALVRAVLVTFAVSMLFIDSFGSPLVALPFWACLGVLLAHRPDQSGMEPAAGRAPADGKEVSRWLTAR